MKINRKASIRIGISLGVLSAAVALYFYSFASLKFVQAADTSSTSSLVIRGIKFPYNSTTRIICSTIYHPLLEYRASMMPIRHYRGVARPLSVKDISYIRLCLEDRADSVDIFVPPQFRSAIKPFVNGPSVDITCDGEPIPNSCGLHYKIMALAAVPD
jgi:hypothetical protein